MFILVGGVIMFKRYVLGYYENNKFYKISCSSRLYDTIEMCLSLAKGVENNVYKFVVFDKYKRVPIFQA